MIIQPFNSNLGLTAASGGANFDLNTPAIRLLSYDGTGHMDITRLRQKAAGQRGETDLGFAQGARFIAAVWQLVGQGLPDYYNVARAAMLDCFTPRAFDPITITFDVPGVGLRAAKVNLNGNLDFLASDRIYTVQAVTAQLKMPDPRFYDPTAVEVNLYPVDGDLLGWLFPWPFPWTFGADTANATTTITYAGGSRLAAEEYPLLRIYGPIDDPVVTNETTNEKIDLTGLSLGDGRYATIDLAAGPYHDSSPTIRLDIGTAVDQYLSDDSDLSSFHLAPAGELLYDGSRADGDNVIRFQGTGATDDTRLYVYYFNRYTGF